MAFLFRTISFHPRDLWIGEWVAILGGASTGAWVAVSYAGRVKDLAALSGTVVSIVIGGVIAGSSIIIAGFDSAYLQHLNRRQDQTKKEIEEATTNEDFETRDYLEGKLPELSAEHQLSRLFAAIVIGLSAAGLLIVWSALTETSNVIVRGTIGGLAAMMSSWTIANLLPALGMLAQFIEIRQKLCPPTS